MCGWKEAGPESPLEWGGGEVWLGDGWRGVWGADVVCEIPQERLRRHRGRGSGHEGRSSDTAMTTGDPGLHGNLLRQFNLFVVVSHSVQLEKMEINFTNSIKNQVPSRWVR